MPELVGFSESSQRGTAQLLNTQHANNTEAQVKCLLLKFVVMLGIFSLYFNQSVLQNIWIDHLSDAPFKKNLDWAMLGKT